MEKPTPIIKCVEFMQVSPAFYVADVNSVIIPHDTYFPVHVSGLPPLNSMDDVAAQFVKSFKFHSEEERVQDDRVESMFAHMAKLDPRVVRLTDPGVMRWVEHKEDWDKDPTKPFSPPLCLDVPSGWCITRRVMRQRDTGY